jgi:AcrR family transcriptional regulator
VPRSQPVKDMALAAPRSAKGAKTRARLVDAAKSVFEEDGFREARISDIAERAGISHGSFYHYFPSKEQVFREVATAQEALLTTPGITAARESSESIDPDEDGEGARLSEYERLRRANRRYLERYRSNARIMGVIEEVSRYDDEVNEARMGRQKHFAKRAEKSIRQLQERGAADPDVDPKIAAVALGSMVGRFAELWLVEGWERFNFDKAVDQITLLWANAVGLKEPGDGPRKT